MRLDARIQELAPDPYEAALKAALADLEKANSEIQKYRERGSELASRVENLSVIIENLAKLLPPPRRALYLPKIAERLEPTTTSSRGTPAYDNVIQMFGESSKKEWTAQQVQEALEVKGIKAEASQVHNILAYLRKKGRIRRISRGRYYVSGIGVGVDVDENDGA